MQHRPHVQIPVELADGASPTPIDRAHTRYGEIIFLESDQPIGDSLRRYGEWAQNELELLGRLVQPGDLIIDVGAFVGTHTLAFSSMVGPTGQVLAFEPQPVVYELLLSNVRTNGLTNVHVTNAGFGRRFGFLVSNHLPDYQAPENFAAIAFQETSELPTDTRCVAAPSIPLDSLNLERCSLIKVTAEGFDIAVMQGGAETVARLRPILYVECKDTITGQAIMNTLPPDTYSYFLHSPLLYNPENFRCEMNNIFGPTQGSYLLAIPVAKSASLIANLLSLGGLTFLHDASDLGEALSRALKATQ